MKGKTRKILFVIWEYLVITVGCAIFVMGWTSFMLPNGIIDGGLTGICAVLSMATGISVDIFYISLQVILIILAVWIMGTSFGAKTLYAIALTTVLFRVFGSDSFHFLQSVPGEFLYVDQRILIAMIGGLMEAIGIGLIFRRGGSTGGTDIFVLLVNKFWPVSPGQVYIYIDLVVIASILFIPGHTFSDVILGYVTMFTFSFGLDFFLMGRKSSVQLLIFSSKFDQIADYINQRMERGVTVLKAVGWFTKSEKDVLLVLVRKFQLGEVTKIVKSIDPKAFVSVVTANDVYGEGFDEIKAGIEGARKKKMDNSL